MTRLRRAASPDICRANGSAGVRNLALVLPTSELVNRVAEMVDEAAPTRVALSL